MKPAAFKYLRADTVTEALQALSMYEDARIIAGGQSLMAMLNLRLVRPAVLIDISGLDELQHIEESGGWIKIGAMVTQVDAHKHELVRSKVPILADVLPHVGHPQTRNRGTIGGSVAHADPSAEIPLALAVAGGRVELRSRRSKRLVMAEHFFKGILSTARRSDELLSATYWPIHRPNEGFAFREFAARHGDFAIASAGAKAVWTADSVMKQALICLGGVADRPILVDVSSSFRTGQMQQVADEVGLAFKAEDDLHASAPYRAQLAVTLALEALECAATRARRTDAHR